MGCSHSRTYEEIDPTPNSRKLDEKAPPQEAFASTYMAWPAIKSLIETDQVDFAWNAILNATYPITEGYVTDAEHWTSGRTNDGHMAHVVRPPAASFSLAVVECRVPAAELTGSEQASALHVAADVVRPWVDGAERRRRLCAVTSIHGRVNLYEWDWDLDELTRVNRDRDLWLGRQCATISSFLFSLRNRS